MKLACMTVLLACMTACENGTGPAGELIFETRIDTAGFPPLVVASGYVEYRAVYRYPCLPFVMTGQLVSRRPNVLEVHVDGTGQCIYNMDGSRMYRARVQDLAPGSYQLRVIHSKDGAVRDTVLNTELTLPTG